VPYDQIKGQRHGQGGLKDAKMTNFKVYPPPICM